MKPVTEGAPGRETRLTGTLSCRLRACTRRSLPLLVGALLHPALPDTATCAGNLVPNPALELDSNADGIPDFWNLGGSVPASCLWDTSSFSSSRHSLLVDDRSVSGYGEWYSNFINVSPNTNYLLSFKRRYSTPGVMRLSVNLHDAAEAFVATATFTVHGTNQAWTEVGLDLPIPSTARKLRLSLASGGSLAETGRIAIDDLSLLPSPRPTLAAGMVRRVESMPSRPAVWSPTDWRAIALSYDALVFDTTRQGQFLPLCRIDISQPNFATESMWMPTYVGSTTHGGEAINSMAAVLGATVAGADKSSQSGRNWVLMQTQFYNDANGEGLVLNLPTTTSGQTFWYEIYPHILFYGLVDRYPDTAKIEIPFSHHTGTASMESIMRSTAGRWRDAAWVMGGKTNRADFNWTAFRFATMQPVYNGQWREPDAAAGISWLEYMAYTRFHDTNFLEAARWGMDALERNTSNPIYENLLPFGALVAARMNAELGTHYNLQRLVDDCFNASGTARYGVGVTVGQWGDREVDGLVGVVTEVGGYAFAMETFSMAGALAPIARYDSRYAHSLGRWLTHLASSAHLFYPDALPAAQQSSAFWLEDTQHVIPYEGLRREWDGKIPYASGDPIFYNWGPKTDLALYGGSHVGFLGGMQTKTSHPRIDAWDLLATDHFHAPALPTFLCYNPEPSEQKFLLPGNTNGNSRIYEATTGRFLKLDAAGAIAIGATSSWVVVICPKDDALSAEGDRLLCDGRVIDYRLGARDVDGDGLPDWWETRYFGDATVADPAARAANGYSLLECLRLGLDPGDPAASFRILRAERLPQGGVALNWSSVGGRRYAIEFTEDLGASGSFRVRGSYTETNAVPGAPGTARFVDDQPGPAGRFRAYRVRLDSP